MNRVIIFSIPVVGCVLFLACLRYCFSKNKHIKYIEIFSFLIYLYGFLYFTFFSREAGDDALIRLQLLKSYKRAFAFDSGFLHVIKQIFTEGLNAGLDSIHIESTETLDGIILNILLFVPFGYMLPCLFKKLQKALWAVVLTGFVCSLLTETIQLVTHLGWFDLDDLLNNTMGCILGVILYRSFLRERKVGSTEEATP